MTSYQSLQNSFRWQIPEYYNIGVDVCDRWALTEPDRLALSYIDDRGVASQHSYGALHEQSNRLANFLVGQGLARGARVGILLRQCPETAVAHIAVYKAGCVAVPLFMLFGGDALVHRLQDSGSRIVITDGEGAGKLAAIRHELPDLQVVVSIDAGQVAGDELAWRDCLATSSSEFTPVQTRADDPALIIYTSGTTGLPKGAVHAHRTLLGHLPGVEISHDLLPQAGDKIWTPADWAWIGGLLDVLLPALHHGVPVVARRFSKFTGEAAFDLLQDHGIRNAFIPPTALKMMRALPNAASRWRLNLRSVASGGEPLGVELIKWGRETLGVTINEFYGQTECNMIVSSAASIMSPPPELLGRVMGRPVPGHELAIVDAAGSPVADGVEGAIAVRRPDPVMFLEYWNNPAATAAKFHGDWLITGDVAVVEAGGWIRFVGRDDDVITSSGYRIGPGEIEDCLLRHRAVRMAAVVGKPDPVRTEIVKAYVVLNDPDDASPSLAADLRAHVKALLSAHEYPREIGFVDELPMTATGKIIRRILRQRARDEV